MDDVKLRPLADGVLVRLAKAKDKSAGGIIIPEANKERPRQGEVLAVGPGVWSDSHGARDALHLSRRPLAVRPGDVVLFGAFTGTQVGEEEDLLLLKESDILAVIDAAAEIRDTVDVVALQAELEGERAITRNLERKVLEARAIQGAVDELLELAWGLLANAGDGDWTKETAQWQEAAARWRERYFQASPRSQPATPYTPEQLARGDVLGGCQPPKK